MTPLERLAALVAVETPLKPKHGTVYLRTSLLTEIREELDRRGFPWRTVHAEARRLQREAQKARKATSK